MTYRENETTRRDSSNVGWVMGALVALLAVGVMVWALNRGPADTASTTPDRNTGSVSRTAPAPGSPTAPGPGAPSRP
jgi:hypothetical protein